MKKIDLQFPIKIFKKNKHGEISMTANDEPILERKIKSVFLPDKMLAKHIRYLPTKLKDAMGKLDPKDPDYDEKVEEFSGDVSFEEMLPLVASVCSLSEDVAGELDIKDVGKIMEEFQNFLAPSQTSGNESSGN